MQVKFTDKAISHLESIIDIFLEYAGERYATKFSNLVESKLQQLQTFPSIGFKEPLLSGRKKLYRSVILYENYKMVYYVDEDTIWIAAFWDMRMNPEKLRRRL